MTYREFLQIENYIVQIEEIKNLQLENSELFNRAETLDYMIRSSVDGYEPCGVKWENASYPLYDSRGIDVPKIKNFLDIMQAALQGILNSLPYYDDICELGKDISYGYNISSNAKSKCDFIVEKTKKYSRNIEFEQSIINARDSLLTGQNLSEEQLNFVFRTLLLDMEDYRKSLLEDKRDLNESVNRQPQNVFNISANGGNAVANASANVQVNVDISIQIDQTVEQVKDACLSPEQETAVLSKLGELKAISQEKNTRKRWDKVKGIFKWLAEQSLQVAGWLVPLVCQIVNVV